MDDQRPQHSWELMKTWLEDPARTAASNACIDALTGQTRFVRRRGQVSKMCFFETASKSLGDESHARAALNLASIVQHSIMKLLESIPLSELGPNKRTCFPALVFLPDEVDYEPLRFDTATPSRSPLPTSVHVDSASGELSADTLDSENVRLQLEIRHTEGLVATVPYNLVADRHGDSKAWTAATGPILKHFMDFNVCRLAEGSRAALVGQLSEVFDFKSKTVRDVSFGSWLGVMACVLRMLRSTAVANIALRSTHHSPSRDQALGQFPLQH